MPENLLPPSAIHMHDARPEDAASIQRGIYPDRSVEEIGAILRYSQAPATERRAVLVVAEVEGQVRAMAQLTVRGERAEIHDLIVAEGWRERGLGRALIGHLTGAARSRGVRVLEIGVEPDNSRALSLYERLGFRFNRSEALDLDGEMVAVAYLTKQLE